MALRLIVSVLTCVIVATSAHRGHGYHGNNHRATGRFHVSNSASHDITPVGGANTTDVTDKFIQEKINAFLNQKNTTELTQFLTALNTTEGQAAIKQLGIDPTMVSKILRQLKGTSAEVTGARNQFQNLCQSFRNVKQRKYSSGVRKVFKIYQVYLVRQAAQKQVQLASVNELKSVLGSLATAENRLGFRGINFGDLLQTLNSRGQDGRQEVIDKLVRWIGQVQMDDLQRASLVVYVSYPTFGNNNTTAPPAGNWTARPPMNNTTTTLPPNANYTTTLPPNANYTTPAVGNSTTTRPAGNQTIPLPRPEPLKKKSRP